MESYSPFFQTLHDERSPAGYLGVGTHASILRAVVFRGPTLTPLSTGTFVDFAVIWDKDHDTRVIKAVESIYRAGFLGSILMIGESKGALNAIVSEHVEDPKLLSSLGDALRAIAQKMEGDPWSSSVRKLDSSSHEIVDDRHDRVSLYLQNLKMVWRLGVGVRAQDRTRGLPDLTDEQVLAIVRCVPGDTKKAEQTRLLLLGSLAKQIGAEKKHKGGALEAYAAEVARKLCPEFLDLTQEQILAVLKCIPGDRRDAREVRGKLLLNLEKQIKAEKAGTPLGLTMWSPLETEDTVSIHIEKEDLEGEDLEGDLEGDLEEDLEREDPAAKAEDRPAKAPPKIRLVEK